MKESKQKIYSNTGNINVLNLVPQGAKYILDIGCGDGSNARLLIKRNCIVDGITISENEKAIAMAVMREVYVHDIEYGLPITENSIYDAVICSHVLEHICYPEQLMKDIHRVLKKNGCLIVALPNIMHYKSRWLLMKGNFNYKDAGIWDYTHFRWYTFETARQLLQDYNYEINLATVTGKIPLNSVLIKLLSPRVINYIYSFIIKISKGLFGYQLLFRAVKINSLENEKL
ncbi:MAG: class I SAM-dependent methyltransferase [Ferruginibacter sp.]